MRVINFAHPLTPDNLAEIEALAECPVTEVIETPSQIDWNEPIEPQIESILDGLGLTARQWQADALLINLPSLNYSAAVLLAQLHGRIGHFPAVIRLCPDTGGLVPRFVVAEVLNLQAVRERARTKRGG